MDDAVVAQVGVDRHDGQVVLEAGVSSDWKMAKVIEFLGNEMLTSILSWQEQNAYFIASCQDDSITALVHSAALLTFEHALGILVIYSWWHFVSQERIAIQPYYCLLSLRMVSFWSYVI